jgi:aquaporin related protein
MGIIYTVAQIAGACGGYGMLMALSPNSIMNIRSGHCLTLPHNTVSGTQAFFMEFFLTFALVFTCCAVWDPRNKKIQDSSSIKIGITVATLCFAGGAYTGTSLNPARSLAPALWNWNWQSHWLYWAGPMLGGVAAALLMKYVFQRNLKITDENDDIKNERL